MTLDHIVDIAAVNSDVFGWGKQLGCSFLIKLNQTATVRSVSTAFLAKTTNNRVFFASRHSSVALVT